jgi:hypothetical protein
MFRSPSIIITPHSDNVANVPVCPPRSQVHYLNSNLIDSGGSECRPGTEQVPASARVRLGCRSECHKISHNQRHGCRRTLGTAYLVEDCHGHLEIADRH